MAPSASPAQFKRASDQSLLIYFAERISPQANEQARKLLHLLHAQPIAAIRNLHPAYCSVLVKFDPLLIRHDQLEDTLRQYIDRLADIALPEPRHLEIPVCYGGPFGPDLTEVGALHGLSPQQVIALHSSTTYLVYFLGFVPGFAYLGEVPSALVTPRLPTPRKSVPPGSVAIAGLQTGVYPFATPGGWRVLGRTPISMFRADRGALSFLSIGDRVRFIPISPERFLALENT
jgi:KipI family sensor histidine kinase inhibitor